MFPVILYRVRYATPLLHPPPTNRTVPQASVTDLNAELKKARSKSLAQTRGGPGSNSSPADSLKGLLFTLPGGAGSDMSRDLDSIERMRDGASGGGKRPEDMSPQELHSALWKILTFRDSSECCFLCVVFGGC